MSTPIRQSNTSFLAVSSSAAALPIVTTEPDAAASDYDTRMTVVLTVLCGAGAWLAATSLIGSAIRIPEMQTPHAVTTPVSPMAMSAVTDARRNLEARLS
jgi:hypothetical protein